MNAPQRDYELGVLADITAPKSRGDGRQATRPATYRRWVIDLVALYAATHDVKIGIGRLKSELVMEFDGDRESFIAADDDLLWLCHTVARAIERAHTRSLSNSALVSS